MGCGYFGAASTLDLVRCRRSRGNGAATRPQLSQMSFASLFPACTAAAVLEEDDCPAVAAVSEAATVSMAESGTVAMG